MDHRRAPRYDVLWPATVRVGANSYLRAQARNVASGGLGLAILERPRFLPSNVMVMLGTSIGPILGEGKLRWERPPDSGAPLLAGLAFTPHAGYSSVRFQLALQALERGEEVEPQPMAEGAE